MLRVAPPRKAKTQAEAHRPGSTSTSPLRTKPRPTIVLALRFRSISPRRIAAVMLPPGESKQKDVRYLDIHEHDQIDEDQLADWVRQASRLPGERM